MSLTEDIRFDNSGGIEPEGPRALYRKLYLALVIILVAGLSFGLGRLSGQGKGGEGVKLEYQSLENTPATAIKALDGSIVASKNGKKYHYSYCPGAKQISEANKITFASPEAAEASGYTLASNCQKR